MSSEVEHNGAGLLWRVFQFAKLSAEEAKETFGYITATITNAVIGTICKAFGVENLQELVGRFNPDKAAALAIESVNKEIDSKIKAALANPVQLRSLVEAIARDPEACRILEAGCHKAETKAKDEAKVRRLENIGKTVIIIYRKPDTDDLTYQDVETLVNRIEIAGVIRGKRENVYYEAIAPWLESQEFTMAETIKSLVLAKTSAETVSGFAKLLVIEGFEPTDVFSIRTRLQQESDLKLKK